MTLRRLRALVLTPLAAFATVLSLVVLVHGQLPGPPVGIPQANQSTIYGYNFAYTWIQNGADGAGMRVAPTLQPIVTSGVTVDAFRVAPTLTLTSNGSLTVTTYSSIHAVAPTVTNTKPVTFTNQALMLVDTTPSGATNNYSIWDVGNFRLDGSLLNNAGANTVTLPTTSSAIPTIYSCGTITSTASCPVSAAAAATAHIVVGQVVLSASGSGTALVTSLSPAFSGTTTFQCIANDTTVTSGGAAKVANTSASSITVTGASTGDTVFYICAGY